MSSTGPGKHGPGHRKSLQVVLALKEAELLKASPAHFIEYVMSLQRATFLSPDSLPKAGQRTFALPANKPFAFI